MISIRNETDKNPFDNIDVFKDKTLVEDIVKITGTKRVVSVVIDNITITQMQNGTIELLYKSTDKAEGIAFLRQYTEKCVERINVVEGYNAKIEQYPKQIDDFVEKPSMIKPVLLGGFGGGLLTSAYYLINYIRKHRQVV